MGYPQTFITITKTATADMQFNLSTSDMWFESFNVHAKTHNALYGDRNAQIETITAGDIVFFEAPTNLKDVFFKNVTAGQNTVVTVAGVLMLEKRMQELGLIL